MFITTFIFIIPSVVEKDSDLDLTFMQKQDIQL